LKTYKKKISALLLAVLMLLQTIGTVPVFADDTDVINLGDYVILGQYEGKKLVWRCVSEDESGKLMLLDETIRNRGFAPSLNGAQTTDLSEITDFSDNSMRETFGSNRWSESSIRTWLNSELSDPEWNEALPESEYFIGNHGYSEEAGFLSEDNFTETEKYAIKLMALKNILPGCDKAEATGGTSSFDTDYETAVTEEKYNNSYNEITLDRIFCLDALQYEKIKENYPEYLLADEGEQYWLRTPLYEKSYGVTYQTAYGAVVDTAACNSEIGVRPAFYINTDALTVESGDGTEENPFIIVGSEPVLVSDISIDKKELNLGVGTSYKLTAKVYPENASDKTVVWSSDSEDVAKVSKDGTVTAVSEGEAKIKASNADGSVFAVCLVNVYNREVLNFEDEAFKKAVIEVCFGGDREVDAPVYVDEVESIKSLNISNREITSLSGIEFFYSLESLNVSGNKLKTIALSNNKSLKTLDVTNSQLISLDVSDNVLLKYLYCGQNNIKELNLKNNHNLLWLDCSDNSLSEITFINNPDIEYLYISDNAFESIDISPLKGLKSFECQNNRITELDLSQNKLLTNINCSNNMLENINVSNQTALKQLIVKENRMKYIDVSNNIKLTYLDVSRNYFEAQEDVLGLNTSKTTLVYYPQYLMIINVESVSIKSESLSLKIGDTHTLSAEVLPQGATNKNIKWSSSNTSIASISENGRVTAYAPGKCVITVTTDDGGFTDSIEVEVIDTIAPMPPTGLKADYVTGSGAKISWNSATDDVKILRYDVYRNGSFLQSVTDTFFEDKNLEPQKNYRYTVKAVDTSENKSEASAEIVVVPKAPVITKVSPESDSTIGGNGTQKIGVYFANTNNAFGATLSVEMKNENGVWIPFPYEITYSEGKEGSHNIIYGEFSKEEMMSGDYSFRFTIKDKDLNSDSFVAVYTLDRTAPKAVEDFSATTGEEHIILSWLMARDADVVKYEIYRAGTLDGTYNLYHTVNGRNNTSYTDTEVFVNEVYYYKIAAVDGFGQRSELSEPVFAMPENDETPPTVTKILPAGNSFVNGNLVISVTAEDNIAVKSIRLQYSSDEEIWIDYEEIQTSGTAKFNFDTTKLSDGDVYIRAIAKDMMNNESGGRPVYMYKVDNTGPMKVSGLSLQAATATTITLSWKDVPDNDFGYFAVEEKNAETGAFTRVDTTSTTLGINIYNLTPGKSYTYRVVAYDTLGNRGTESEEITVSTILDSTAPVITGISPNPARYSSSIPMRITAGDDYLVDKLDIEYSYDLITWIREIQLVPEVKKKQTTFSHDFDLSNKNEGSIFIRPIAYDMAGNVSDKSEKAPYVEYYTDRTAPAVPEGFTAVSGNGYVEIKWQQGEEEDLAGYYVYRSESADGNYSLIKSGLKQINYIDKNIVLGKVYYYKIAVSDTAGNISKMTDYVYAHMLEDKEKPVIYSFSPDTGYVISKSTPVNVLAGDNHKVAQVTLEYRTEDSEWKVLETRNIDAVSQVVSFSVNRDEFTDGTYYFRAFAKDGSGNVGDYSDEYCYTIDTLPPTVSNVCVTPGEESVTITWESQKEADLSGFYIYRKTSGGSYSKIGSVSVKDETSYEYTNHNLNSDTKYMYKVEAVDVYGNQSSMESEWVYPNAKTPENDETAPIIFMNIANVMEVGVEEYFDASSSWDNVGIVSYYWDFGDGTVSSKSKPAHSYSETGTYTVTLIVADEAGNSSEKTALIKVEERRYLGSVTVQVKDTFGSPVVGAGVYFNLGSEDVSIYGTNSNGLAVIREYEGTYPVGVYADGYLPAKIDVQIIKNSDDAFYTVIIEKKEIIVGELTHERMTLDEIIAAGIDPYAPENQNVYKFEIVLTYGAEEYVASGIIPGGNPKPIRIPIIDTPDYKYDGYIIWPSYGGGGGGGGGGTYIPPKPLIAIVEIPGEASWLKEFFSVHLHLMNQADEQFAVDDCVVNLNYPKEGLTLMTGVVDKYSETETVNIGTIGGQQEKDIYWILRGDVAGEYDISADFTGTLRDFNETITARFECEEPIKVYGSENLFLDIMVEDTIPAYSDSSIRVGLTNEGVVDVYMPNVVLYNLPFLRKFKTLNGQTVQTDMRVLTPGETLWADYLIPRSINDVLEENKDKEFYLYSAVVNSIGGNVTLKHRFNVVPAYSISPDLINVYQKDSNGNLQPVNILEPKRFKNNTLPDIVIETLGFDENMQLSPMSREIIVKDEHLIEKGADLEEVYGATNLDLTGKTFKTQTGSDGRFTLKGYDLFSMITKKPYNICISSTRAVEKKIPVVMRDSFSETTTVEGHVYYKGKGTLSPIEGAEVTIGDKVTTTDKKGKFSFKYIPTGQNNVLITKDGYADINELLEVSEDERIDYYMNKMDTSKPHIKSVQNTKFTGCNGNGTIIPEGMVEGDIQFVITSDLKDESLVEYKYYIEGEDGNIKSEGGFNSSVYSRRIRDLKKGDRLLFTVVTRDKDGNEHESDMFDTDLIIVKAPDFLAKSVMYINDLGDAGKFKEIGVVDTKLPVTLTKENQKLMGYSLFNSTWVKTDDEELKKASYMMEGLKLSSKTEMEFPLKMEYNLDGTFTLSFGASVSHKPQEVSYYRSVGDYIAFKNSNLTFEQSKQASYASIFDISELSEGDNKPLDIGGDAKLDFTVKYDTALNDWKMVFGITLEANAKAKVFKAQAPVVYGVAGGYADLAVGGSATARWEPVSTWLSRAADTTELDFGILPKNLKAGIEAKGGVGIYAIDSDIASGGFYAKLKADVHLLPQQKLVLGYELGAEANVLVWNPTKAFFEDSFEFRLFDNDNLASQSVFSLLNETESRLTIGKVSENKTWNGDGEELTEEVFTGSKPQLIKLSDDKAMLLFADFDAKRNADNPVQLMYSVYDGKVWSDPKAVYDDLSLDLYPSAVNVSDGKVYATWVNMKEVLKDVQTITIPELKEKVYPKMEVSTAVFDTDTMKWSEPESVSTKDCIKKSPKVASDGKSVFTVWVQNKNNAEYGNSLSPDTIGYHITGIHETVGELEIEGGSVTSVSASVMQNTAYISYIRNSDGINKGFYRIYNGRWSDEKELNSNAFEDKSLRMAVKEGDPLIYYINGNKIYCFNINTAKGDCVVYDEDIENITGFELAGENRLIWTANKNGNSEIFISENNEGIMSSVKVKADSNGGIMSSASAIDLGGKVMLSSIENVFEEENTKNVLSVRSFENKPDVYLENLHYDSLLIPGIENAVSVNIGNNGLVASNGFNVYVSATENKENTFGEPYEYKLSLEPGRNTGAILNISLPEDYDNSYIYVIVEDDNGTRNAYKQEIVYNKVEISEVKKKSNVPGKMNFTVNVDNLGFVNYDEVKVVIRDGVTEEVIAEKVAESIAPGTSNKISIDADFGGLASKLCLAEITAKDGTVIDSRLVDVAESDYGILLGDYFCDDEVNPADATAILKALAYNSEKTERQIFAGDINENNKVEPNDVIAILQYCAGLIKNFK